MQTQAELLIYVVDRLHGTNGHPRHGFIRATKAAFVVGVDPQTARLWLGADSPPGRLEGLSPWPLWLRCVLSLTHWKR